MEYPSKKPKGKGGNIKTERNLWAVKDVTTAPDLRECVGMAGAIENLLRAGCAIIIGRTRDGGANVLTVLDGDNRHKTYCSNADELDDAFRQIDIMFAEP
jgi:hypothetical protein